MTGVRRVTILGGGRMGLAHLRAWEALGERARVTSVCSRRPVTWLAGTPIRQITDLEDASTDAGADIVDICLPTPLHRLAAELALRAGKHVLIEKPVALSLVDADALASAAASAPGTVMVAHVVRFFPGYAMVAELARELGRPVSVHAYRLSAGSLDITWIRDVAQSGGVTLDLLVHDFDQANLHLGDPVSAYARLADTSATMPPGAHGAATVVARYAGGGVASIEGSVAMPPGYPFSTGIRVVCEGGAVEHHYGGAAGSVVRVYPRDGAPRELTVPPADPYAAQAAYFLDCLENETPPLHGSLAQARAALAVGLAALRSTSTGIVEAIDS